MHGWRHTAKTIAVTATVTSAAWLIGGAIYFAGRTGPRPAAPSDADVARGSPVTLAAAVESRGPTGLIIPVAGVRPEQLVDTYNQAREDGARRHDAIDIMAPRGTPVVAAAAGKVEKLFVSGRGGNTVYIRSPDRALIYYYAHLDTYAADLAAGQRVRQGQQIGTVGFTGDASPDGPHLHFEVQRTDPAANWWQHTASLNPYPLLAGHR